MAMRQTHCARQFTKKVRQLRIWTEFRGDRGTKSKPISGPHLVDGFLTTAPNAIVEPI
jgi:hypothetical protein